MFRICLKLIENWHFSSVSCVLLFAAEVLESKKGLNAESNDELHPLVKRKPPSMDRNGQMEIVEIN